MSGRVAFACAAVLALAGCGGDDEPSAVSFQLFGDPEELQVYRDLVAAYEEETGEEIEMIEVADREAHLQKLTTSFAGGSPPDVFLVNYRNYGGYADRGVLDPVGPRLEASEELARDQFYPQPMEAFTFDGELQCMPQNASSLVVYYNRDLFEEIGLPEPARDWSYAEFRATAVELTTSEHDGLGVEPGVVRVAPFVWSAGGELVDDPTAPTRFTLESEAAQAGLEAFLDLAQFGPSHQEFEAKPPEERFLDGEVAMFMSSRREVPVFRTITEFDWDVASFPTLGEETGILHSDAYCLTEGEQADAGWQFIEFAVGAEGQRLAAEGGRTVPSMKSVARSDAFLDPSQPPASSEVFLDAIPNIRRLPISPNWAQVEEAADLALEEAFFEGGEIEELLQRLRQETAGKF
jgi:multiple sugar transport system substrate-binding protein